VPLPERAQEISWSGTNRAVVTCSGGRVFLVDVRTGGSVAELAPTSSQRGFAWARSARYNDDVVAFASDKSLTYWQRPLSGLLAGTPFPLVRLQSATQAALAPPQQRRVAVVGDGPLCVLDLTRGGVLTAVAPAAQNAVAIDWGLPSPSGASYLVTLNLGGDLRIFRAPG